MKARLQRVTDIGGVLRARIVRTRVVAVLPVKRTRFLADVADFTP
jgi:hypothetical protein